MELAALLIIILGIVLVATIFCIFRTNSKASDILSKLEILEVYVRDLKRGLREKTEEVPGIKIPVVTQTPPPVKIIKPVVIPPPVIIKSQPVQEGKKESSEFERRASEILSGIWQWIVCGETSSKDNVSKEYSIATTWLVRASVIIIVMGIVFLLKYSIEKNLISPEVRVFLGMLSGAAMLAAGLKTVKGKYRPIALGLCGGGLAVFYFSIFASSMMYKLIGALPAFALMALVTFAAGILAIRLNAILIALTGICGGYLTPVLLNTGVKNLEGLFSYLLLLGIGTIYVARHKDWKLLNILSFMLTYLLFFGALNKFYSMATDFVVAVSFLTTFFLLFSAQTLIFNIINKLKSTAIELIMLFLNTSIFLAAAYNLVSCKYPGKYAAVVTIFLAVFYIAHIIIFIRNKLNDRKLLIILSGFAGFAIMLTPPILLSGAGITASWALMALAFLWMGKKLDSRFITSLAYILYMLATARFVFFDFGNKFTSIQGEYFSGLLSRLGSMGVLIFSYAASWKILCGKTKSSISCFAENDINIPLNDKSMARILIAVFAGLFFIFLEFEMWQFASSFYPPAREAMMSFIIAAAAFISFTFARKTGLKVFMGLSMLLAFALALKIILADVISAWQLSSHSLRFHVDYTLMNLVVRFADIVPALALFWLFFKSSPKEEKDFRTIFGTAFLISLFAFLSIELNTFLGVFLPKFAYGGISILWGIYALSLLTCGILKNAAALRYAGLVLFAITVAKVFMTDLAALSQLYRIIAFVIVGLVLLGGAFVYIRFKGYFENLSGKTIGKDSEKCTD